VAGVEGRGFRIYVPRVFENLDYVLPRRNANWLRGHIRGKRLDRESFKKALLRDFNLPRGLVGIIISRKVSDLKRIDQVLHSIIDCILLAFPAFFIENTEYKLIKYVLRKVIAVGTFSVDTVTKFWKELTSHIYSVSNLQRKLLSRDNPFKVLLANRYFKEVLSLKDKQSFEGFAHLSSTRGFPPGGRKTRERSKDRFLEVVTTSYEASSKDLRKILRMAEIVGRKCANRTLPTDAKDYGHISLSSAGTFDYTVNDGGRAREIIDDITPLLMYEPPEDELIDLGWARLSCPAGTARWKTWFRKRPPMYSERKQEVLPDMSFFSPEDLEALQEETEEYPQFSEPDPEPFADFGEALPEKYFNVLIRQGFDHAIGMQILACATLRYLEWSKTGMAIPTRVTFVPEPGGKVRTVTTCQWWVVTLQQVPSHIMRTYLFNHPSAVSSMMKTDQAWQSLYLINNKDYPEGSSVLSSDLKEASDHIPFVVAIQLFRGFWKGIGVLSPFMEICLSLMGPREIYEMVDGENLPLAISCRAMLMGEPLTKAILTLQQLVAEEWAIRDYLRIPDDMPVQVSWRTYHVGGDDILAIGPLPYLHLISEKLVAMGAELSPEKHLVTIRITRYCEKFMDTMRLLYDNSSIIQRVSTDYLNSPWVDSIKVRLLSPMTKSTEVRNERNTAIGKALSLGRTLKWLPKSTYTSKRIKMIRDRFFQRMGALLPEKTSGLFWQLLLPTNLGGLNLWVEDDIDDIAAHLPAPTKCVLVDLLSEERDCSRDLRELTSLLKNHSYRGYLITPMDDELEKLLGEDFFSEGVQLEAKAWKTLIAEYKLTEFSQQHAAGLLERNGWLTKDQVLDRIMRPILFSQILSGDAKQSGYNTEKLTSRYARYWDSHYRGDPYLSPEDLRRAIRAPQRIFLYRAREYAAFAETGGFHTTNLFKELDRIMPTLRILWEDISLKWS